MSKFMPLEVLAMELKSLAKIANGYYMRASDINDYSEMFSMRANGERALGKLLGCTNLIEVHQDVIFEVYDFKVDSFPDTENSIRFLVRLTLSSEGTHRGKPVMEILINIHNMHESEESQYLRVSDSDDNDSDFHLSPS